MIEVILFVAVLLVIVAVWFFCGRVDNTHCLEFKESVDKRFRHRMQNSSPLKHSGKSKKH